MDADLNRKSLMIGVPGIVLQIAGNVMARMADPNTGAAMAAGGLVVLLVGTVMLITGLSFYARAKGYSGWMGLLGLLSIIGLIILGVMPDKNK